MAVVEQDLHQIELARRTAVREVIREMNAEQMIDLLLEFPERIRKQQEAVGAARQAVAEAENEVQLQESVLIAEVSEATDPKTGKAMFSNDTLRKAELNKRKSTSKEYRAAQKMLDDANEALRSAQFDLERLQNEFSALRHATDFKRELFRALVN